VTARRARAAALALWLGAGAVRAQAQPPLQPVVPKEQRGRLDAERVGHHDAANIRTRFWNFGMVSDYPPNPGDVDLSVFHSAEVPKGSGMNYSDGITPFVLAKIPLRSGGETYIMETGFRERQAESYLTGNIMRFEPRPGYFQADPNINRARAPAISNDPRTWPLFWPDKLNDPDDPGWTGPVPGVLPGAENWNGYFGKRASADQESFTVMDDDFYDTFDFRPDSRDDTRRGLGLRIEVRGFQWANPQAGNVIFWHYDITNEGTTDYNDNIIFGLYMDSGVGGSTRSCDQIFESDDDNAFFDRTQGLNLVYTWDNFGHGRDRRGSCSPTGYLGYAYLETPGNPLDGIDNDADGIRDERRDGPPGTPIDGQPAIRAYVEANYRLADFEAKYGPLEEQPAFRVARWWPGDEDMDWTPEFDDVGADGVDETFDTGERDLMPTDGEPNFNRTDLNESDQIGLTGFKLNRIKAGQGNPNPEVDGILFYIDRENWPPRLYEKFTDPVEANRFDPPLAANYNLGFLFASGTFRLPAGARERFSLALAYGTDLQELRTNVGTVQQIYDANYQFAVPPPLPTVHAEGGDGYVTLTWDDAAERGIDPVKHNRDFEGYRIYRSTDPDFRDLVEVRSARGNPIPNLYKPMVQFDLVDSLRGYTRKTVEGVSYYLGNDTGITHTWTDTTVTNGQEYFYSVTSYDFGFEPEPYTDRDATFPSENPVAAVTQTTRGGIVLPPNIVQVRPNPRALGFVRAGVDSAVHVAGTGHGQVGIAVINSDLVESNLYSIGFRISGADSIRAEAYWLRDSTEHEALIDAGTDLEAAGIGPIGEGLMPLVLPAARVTVDSARTGFTSGSATTMRLSAAYQAGLSPNLRRPGYPDSISVVFSDTVGVDTSLVSSSLFTAHPVNFRVIAHTATGDMQLDFRHRDLNSNGRLDGSINEVIDIATYAPFAPGQPQWTWRLQPTVLGTQLTLGDVFELRLKLPFGAEDLFVFQARARRVDAALAQAAPLEPYVVPNPYVEAASFEPARFAVSGRGVRRMEFRGLPAGATIRIYTVRGSLVQTLRHDGSDAGFVAWNLRTKDNLDVAPGLYVYHVDAPGKGTHVGKFGIVK